VSPKLRILAADDDRITRRLLVVNLERWGYDVVLAADGLEAWEILQDDHAPEIVVLDWVMPGMDGIEVCRALRKQTDRAYRYVLLLAAKAQKNDVITAFEAGADDYLTKPINPRDLEDRLATAQRSLEARRRNGVAPTRPGESFEPLSEVTKVEPESPTQAGLAGKVVGGKYKVVHPIASGGMGSVWEGVHMTLGTRVAIKFIRPEYAKDNDSLARFETEARVMARLNTRYAVHVYDFGVTPGGLPYLVMEYLEGRSITEVVEKEGPLPIPAVASVISQAAHALEKAHKLGIIHRDVKPDNIMLLPDDEEEDGASPWRVKLVDFGVAKVLLEQSAEIEVDSGLTPMPLRRPTARGVLLGTPAFMSPEQLLASGVADKYADLWGLAVCAFVAATGKLPFSATTLGDLVKQVCLHPPPIPSQINPKVPQGFDAWFARACASTPSERFQSGYEFARELQAACGIVRTALFSTYPTPLPGYAASDPFTPPTGLAAVHATSSTTPAPIKTQDPRMGRGFSPAPPRAPSRVTAVSPVPEESLHPLLGAEQEEFVSSGRVSPVVSVRSASSPSAARVSSKADPDRTVQLPSRRDEAPAAQDVGVAPRPYSRAVVATPSQMPTTFQSPPPRSSRTSMVVGVAIVVLLCAIAFALGSRFRS
jgi:serine/threonine-protein kinase